MNFKEYIQSKSFGGIIVGVSIAVVFLLIFQAGIFVGYRKASFAYRFGDNYYRAFERRSSAPLGFPVRDEFRASHGAVGEVLSISLPTLTVVESFGAEKTIRISTSTLIRKFTTELQPEDIKTGDFVVTIGGPNEDSQIEAKLIRIVPSPQKAERFNQR